VRVTSSRPDSGPDRNVLRHGTYLHDNYGCDDSSNPGPVTRNSKIWPCRSSACGVGRAFGAIGSARAPSWMPFLPRVQSRAFFRSSGSRRALHGRWPGGVGSAEPGHRTRRQAAVRLHVGRLEQPFGHLPAMEVAMVHLRSPAGISWSTSSADCPRIEVHVLPSGSDSPTFAARTGIPIRRPRIDAPTRRRPTISTAGDRPLPWVRRLLCR